MIAIHPRCIQPLPAAAAPVDRAAPIGAEIARSISPAENPNPDSVPVATTAAATNPEMIAYARYSNGATNANANSSGSVTPVKNATAAAESMNAHTAFLCSLSAFLAIANPTAGRPNIIIG